MKSQVIYTIEHIGYAVNKMKLLTS